MPDKKQLLKTQRTKQLSVLMILVLATFLILSIQHDGIFLDRLVPASCIIAAIVFIRNLEERH